MEVPRTHVPDLRTILKAALLYHSGKAQKEIAKQLGLTPSTVSRLLARSRDFVELRYHVPGNSELEAKLVNKFGLMDAVVVETGSQEQATAIVGQAAAQQFLSEVKVGDAVALSCGETLLEMLKALPTQPSLRLTISQLSVESDASTIHQSPATLVGLLRAKCSPRSDVIGVQLPPLGVVPVEKEFREQFRKGALLQTLRTRALRSNVIFIGVGNPAAGTGSFCRIADQATRGRFQSYVRRLDLVGEINNRVYDRKGKDRTDDVPGLSELAISIITLDDLKRLAKNRTKHRVIGIATGLNKIEAIRVALQMNVMSVLVTGRDTAERFV